MLWYDQLQNPQLNEQIAAINIQLLAYGNAYEQGTHSEEDLKNIIKACDSFIITIPKKERMCIYTYDLFWKIKIFDKYPGLKEVTDIQKNAVNRLYLPKASNDTKARWALIRELITGKHFSKPLHPGRMMDKDYWVEFKFRGSKITSSWMRDSGVYGENYILSYSELLEAIGMRRGIDLDPTYLKDPAPYKITFKDGLLYREDQTLFDTNYSNRGSISQETLYVVGLDGSLYASTDALTVASDGITAKLHHSSFFQGKPVLCAGTIKATDGILNGISRLSGHYQPDENDFIHFLRILRSHQVDLTKVKFIGSNLLAYSNYDRFSGNAQEYLDSKTSLLSTIYDHSFEIGIASLVAIGGFFAMKHAGPSLGASINLGLK